MRRSSIPGGGYLNDDPRAMTDRPENLERLAIKSSAMPSFNPSLEAPRGLLANGRTAIEAAELNLVSSLVEGLSPATRAKTSAMDAPAPKAGRSARHAAKGDATFGGRFDSEVDGGPS
jgi:hypothetical protein